MITLGTSLSLALGAAAVGYALFRLYEVFIAPLLSPIRDLPGPPNPSFIWGNLKEILDAENSVLHEAWTEKYGNTLMYRAWFQVSE